MTALPRPLEDILDFAKGRLGLRPGRLWRPGNFATKPTAGSDFEGCFLWVPGEGAWVCQKEGGAYQWRRSGGGFYIFNVQDYGASPSASAATNAAAIQATITAAEAVGDLYGAPMVYVPYGTYAITGSSTEILRVRKMLTIFGDGMLHSRLVADSSTGDSTDILRITPDAGTQIEGFALRDIFIGSTDPTLAQTAYRGRHAVSIDLTLATPRYIENANFERVIFGGTKDYSFAIKNNTVASPSNYPGTALLHFDKCFFIGGASFDAGADSTQLLNCQIGRRNGIYVNLVAGAGNFLIDGCSVTCEDGIIVDAAQGFQLVNSYVEAVGTFPPTQTAMVQLRGATANLLHPIVHGNIIGAVTQGIKAIVVDAATNADIDFNRVGTDVGVAAIHVTANATTATVGRGNHQFGAGSLLLDASAGTRRRPDHLTEILTDSTTWDPGNIVNGAAESKAVAVSGAELGDFALWSFSLAIPGNMLGYARVTNTDVVTVTLSNWTGGDVDLGSGTLYARVLKRI